MQNATLGDCDELVITCIAGEAAHGEWAIDKGGPMMDRSMLSGVRRGPMRAFALLSVASLLAVSCGGDDDEGTAEDPTASADTSEASAAPELAVKPWGWSG